MSQTHSRKSLATPKTRPRKSLLGFGSASTKLRTQGKATPLEKKQLTYSAAKPPLSASSRRWSTQGTNVKDTRPLTHKSYQRCMMDAIIEFLNESGYAHVVSVKILSSPSTKDFLRIFEHLYNFILSNFSLDQKNYREEIPALLKSVVFPFHISKSTMSGIGSMHAWPTLLGALHWLVELIQLTNSIDIESVLFPPIVDEDLKDAHKHTFFEHSIKSYHAFLIGHDNFVEENKMLELAVMRKSGLCEEDNHALQQDVINLENELHEMENEPDILEEAMRQKAELQEMMDKVEQQISEADQENTLLLQKHAQYVSQLKEEHEFFDEKRLGDVNIQEELKRKSAEIEEQVDRLAVEKERLEEQNDEREVRFSRIYNRCSSVVNEYNDIARRLMPNHSIQQYIGEQSMLLHLDHSQNNLNDFKQRLKPLLIELSHNLTDDRCKLEKEKIRMDQEADKLHQLIKTKENVDLLRLEGQYSVLVKELEDAADLHEKESKGKMEEYRQKENQLDKKQKDVTEVLNDEKSKLTSVRRESEELRAQHIKEEDAAVEDCLKFSEEVLKHKNWVECQIDEINNVLRGHIQAVKEATIQL